MILLCNTSFYITFRIELLQTCFKVEKKWLANMLANKKVVMQLLKFLKTTKLEGKKAARKEEKKVGVVK